MSMDFIKKIEENISELEARFKKNTEFVNNANASIDSLTTQKLGITDEINRISGALHAFRFALSEFTNTQTTSDKAQEIEIEMRTLNPEEVSKE